MTSAPSADQLTFPIVLSACATRRSVWVAIVWTITSDPEANAMRDPSGEAANPRPPCGDVVSASARPLPSAVTDQRLLTPPLSYVNKTWLPSAVHCGADGCLI